MHCTVKFVTAKKKWRDYERLNSLSDDTCWTFAGLKSENCSTNSCSYYTVNVSVKPIMLYYTHVLSLTVSIITA